MRSTNDETLKLSTSVSVMYSIGATITCDSRLYTDWVASRASCGQVNHEEKSVTEVTLNAQASMHYCQAPGPKQVGNYKCLSGEALHTSKRI